MGKYIKLLRLKIALAFFFPFVLGLSVASVSDPGVSIPKAVAAVISFFCASFFSSTLNFYSDVEADRIFTGVFKDMDLKSQPFVTGEMNKRETAIALAVSMFSSLGLSLYAGLRVLIYMAGFMLVVGVLYSHPKIKLKGRPLADILCNVLGMGFSLFAGLSIGKANAPSIAYLFWGALFIAIVYIPTVVNDVPFDKAAGFKTSGVVFGAERLLVSMIPLTLLMSVLAVVVFLDKSLVWQFRVTCLALTPLTVIGVIVIFFSWTPPRINLNPDIVLIPMYFADAFFLAFSFHRIVS